MNSNAVERLCKPLIEKLWNAAESEKMFKRATDSVLAAAGGNLEAAALRTEPFTDALKIEVAKS
ncbi:hypothetical protein [[Acidovorax] ebreus]|uniref:hypothetical protein n=1 Tax=Diaphorobacter sp. LI3 TaxID=2952886 RepID=UPI00204EE6C7|nr:hypothetical protein MRB47_10855 [Diaphorobacter sp. LI3]